MKKIITFIICLLIFPLMVLADAGAPMIKEYEVRVSNANGTTIKYYNFDTRKEDEKNLPFDTVLTVYMESVENGVLYGEVNAKIDGKDISGKVKLSDCKLINEEYKPTNDEKWSGKIYVVTEGAYLYKGPSKMYDKVSDKSIPVGTTLNYEYDDGNFVYVTYNGMSGWVLTASGLYNEDAPVAESTSKNLLFLRNVTMYEKPGKAGNNLGVIPKDTKLDVIYSYEMDCENGAFGDFYYYVKYNNKYGWIATTYGDLAIPVNYIIFSKETQDACIADDADCKVKIKIPAKTIIYTDYILDQNYGENSTYYFTYNNQKLRTDLWEVYSLDKYKLLEDVNLYDNYEGAETSKVQKKGIIEAYWVDNWFYIPSLKSWVKLTQEQVRSIDDEMLYISNGSSVVEPDEPNTEPDEPNSNTTSNNNNSQKVSTKQVVIYSVLGSLILVLVIIIIILLVNRKKPVVEDPVKEKEVEDKKE